ncbi:hypothetical protein [Halococcus saccharolyticus]|uniref:Uncharacterized protein n=1 Tax=Halococcus saccharolyticus DSM 5350 TaxID=1227455 RepID=M0MT37_9EURY|nr:hypothetical protein [Halococcus saccharolyticus]EMA47620.1 hypothetical protein C449_01117 [Halococcus saccharolyticus DSM 5350]
MTLVCDICETEMTGEYLKAQIVDSTVHVPHPEATLGEVIGTAFVCSTECKGEWLDTRSEAVEAPETSTRSKWLETPEAMP